jgi:hypothetical protein
VLPDQLGDDVRGVLSVEAPGLSVAVAVGGGVEAEVQVTSCHPRASLAETGR